MKYSYPNRTVKWLAFLLLAALTAGGFWASVVTIGYWDTLWIGGSFYEDREVRSHLELESYSALELAALYQQKAWEETLNYRDEQRRLALEAALNPERTNFRYQVHRQDGTLLCGNVEDGALDSAVYQTTMGEHILWQGLSDGNVLDAEWENYNMAYLGDALIWVPERDEDQLQITSGEETLLFSPREAAQAAQYGWSYYEEEWHYNLNRDSRIQSAALIIEYGLAQPLSIEDDYSYLELSYERFRERLPIIASLALVLDLMALTLLLFLCTMAGHAPDCETIQLARLDRIPYGLYLLVLLGAGSLLLAMGDSITYSLNAQGSHPDTVIGIALISFGIAACCLAALLTTVTRIKARSLLKSTLVYLVCSTCMRWLRACSRWCREVGQSWPLIGQVGAVLGAYLLMSIVTAPTVILFVLWQGLTFTRLLRLAKQWQQIRAGTARIVGGEPGFVIDTKGFSPLLREHAGQLNDLGGAISAAVDAHVKSERFKAELITNVSHDLKTPLTSIINYVDLMKKESDPAKLQTYLEVLDRKSQRLKKLTEDLVEASKASTGNLSVSKTKLGMCQLAEQAAAEYEERFAQRQLTLLSALPSDEVYVEADSRHIWRVLDNLLSNCLKYALEHTRIYLSVTRWSGTVCLSLKNISQQPLNIPPDQLMERFVRGESSRTTEGSGLGLSIAQSLTELQGGIFQIDIDGDLFKATITFPEAAESEAVSSVQAERLDLNDLMFHTKFQQEK